jgi:hypothetical protein
VRSVGYECLKRINLGRSFEARDVGYNSGAPQRMTRGSRIRCPDARRPRRPRICTATSLLLHGRMRWRWRVNDNIVLIWAFRDLGAFRCRTISGFSRWLAGFSSQSPPLPRGESFWLCHSVAHPSTSASSVRHHLRPRFLCMYTARNRYLRIDVQTKRKRRCTVNIAFPMSTDVRFATMFEIWLSFFFQRINSYGDNDGFQYFNDTFPAVEKLIFIQSYLFYT